MYKINEIHYHFLLETLFESAVKISYDDHIGLIVLYTDNYDYTKSLTKYRPKCRVMCPINDFSHYHYVRLFRCVTPFFTESNDLTYYNEKLFLEMIEYAKFVNQLHNKYILIINAYAEKKFLFNNGMFFRQID